MTAKADRAKSIFLNAIENYTPDQWQVYLDGACGDDVQLRVRVEDLLKAHNDLGSIPNAQRTDTDHFESANNQVGMEIGPYKLLQEIGEGGFGVVYMAEQEQPVQRRVAIKIIKPGMDSREVIARFEAERQALAMMDHPNIARILDAGSTETGSPYFVMELVRGVAITKYCDQNHLSPQERLQLFGTVCQAVQHAHQKGVIHRDIKPSNVMITLHDGNPVVKIIDFGIAKAINQRLTEKTLFTKYAEMIGTPLYMSPEQAELSGLDIDTRADIYSLGVLLYELLTGATPFDRQRLREAAYDEIRRIIREEEPPKPSTKVSTLGEDATAAAANRKTEPKKLSDSLRGELDWIVMKGLEKDRSRRYETASEFAKDIECHLNHEPVQACPPSKLYRLRKLIRRNRAAIATGGVLATALILCAAISTWQAVKATNAYNEAETARRGEAEQKELAKAAESHALEAARNERGLRAESERLRQLAEDSAEQRRAALTQLNITAGVRRMEDREFSAALPYLVEALKIDHDSRQAIHRLRLQAALERCPKPTQVWQVGMKAGAIDISPDGRLVVTYNSNSPHFTPETGGQARLWELQSGKLVAELSHEKKVTVAKFSPDGRHLVTCSLDRTARVWEATTGRPITNPLKHDYFVRRIVFSPDSKLFLTCSISRAYTFSRELRNSKADDQGEARVWEVESGHLRHRLHRGNLLVSGAFSPGGEEIATASADGTIRLWKTSTGEPLAQPLRHNGSVLAVRFRAGGNELLSSSLPRNSSDQEVWKWDITNRENPKGRIITRSLQLTAGSRDGKYISGFEYDNDEHSGVFVWDLDEERRTGQQIKHDHPFVWSEHFSEDGQWLVTGSEDRTARVWDLVNGQMVTAPLLHNTSVFETRFTPDRRKVLTLDTDGILRVWDLAASCARRSQFHFRSTPHRLLWMQRGTLRPSGQSAALTGVRARVWSLKTGRAELPTVDTSSVVLSASFSPDGRLVAFGDEADSVFVFDLHEKRRRFRLARAGGQHLAFSPDGRRLATAGGENTAKVWDTESGQLLATLRHSEAYVMHVAFDRDGQRLVTATANPVRRLYRAPASARIWDVATGTPLTDPLPHPTHVFHAAFSPDGKRVVTSCYDGDLAPCHGRLWDAETGQPIGEPLQHKDGVRMASFSPDGRSVVTASEDGTARIWDGHTGEPLGAPLRHKHHVYSAVFSSDGELVLTASRDKTARVWDALTGQPVTPALAHDDFVRHAWFLPGNRSLVTICRNGTVTTWPLVEAKDSIENLQLAGRFISGQQDEGVRGTALLHAEEFLDAWKTARSVIPDQFESTHPDDLAWHREQLNRAEKLKAWPEAIEHLDFLIKREPASCRLPIRRGRAQAGLENWSQAAADYEIAIRLGADEWPLRFHLGRAYAQQDRFNEAIDSYLEAMLADSDTGYREIGAEVKRQHWELARQDCTAAIENGPSHAAAWYCRGLVARQLNQNDEAISDLGKAIELGLDDWRASYSRARLNLERRSYDEVVADANRVIDGEFSKVSEQARVWLLYSRARAHWNLGDYKAAIDDLENRLELRPRSPNGLNQLAWYLCSCPVTELQQADRAVQLASRAAKLRPASRTYRNTLGIAQYRAGHWNEAIKVLATLATADGTSFDYFFLAMAHWQRNEREDALTWYTKGLDWMQVHDRVGDEELTRFRMEAAALLDLAD